jgi:hypothetical protein
MVHGYDPSGWEYFEPEAWQHVVSDYDSPRPAPHAYDDLYSVPRRFDLASLLVVTTAYAILFTGMTVLAFPLKTFLYFAFLIAVVAVAQSLFTGRTSPRSISLIAGTAYHITVTIGLGLLAAYFPTVLTDSGRSADARFSISLMLFTTLFSPASGYLSGVLVAGAFLVADYLRKFLGLFHLHRATADSRAEVNSPWDE